jgi:hypothetical protein
MTIVLILHVLAGMLALIAGALALFFQKGGKRHQLIGRIFFYSMLGVCFSSIVLSLAKQNIFLLHIGIFAFYQTWTGFKAARNKSLRPTTFDWVNLVVSAINSVIMLASLNPILMIFGLIGSLQQFAHVKMNIQLIRGIALPPLSWLKMHIGMMIGAYISTVTAFLVVNISYLKVSFIADWFRWILPSMVFAPMIVWYTRKYTGKIRTSS